ncbi:MAG: biotin-dependent carboxyltransferase family protein [Dongiaceae bacterium]
MSVQLKVIRAGMFDTLQDFGRVGFQELGMPTAGAMDLVALRLANALVGNSKPTAALEIGVTGPKLRVEADSARLAVVGLVRLSVTDDTGETPQPLEANRSHSFTRGQVLTVGAVADISVAYLAVDGGFALADFMGSLSTYTRAGLGGLDGRKLRDGDELPLRNATANDLPERRLVAPFDYGSGPVRVVLGPQDDYFSAAGLSAFLTGTYTVTNEADRMGIRLKGPVIAHDDKGADITSDGIAPGAIQVPAAGQPIILLADRQTIGGYTKIATVISADLPRVSRLLPGKTLRFTAVDVAEAEQARRDLEARIRTAIATIAEARAGGGIDLDALYRENLIDGVIA